MSELKTTVRRANVEDLPRLRELWLAEGYSVGDLEKRFTEFQVLEIDTGLMMAAIGLQLGNRHGHIHSEVYTDAAKSGESRAILWQRLQTLSKNHGLVRLWKIASSNDWEPMGFSTADESALKKLPAPFGSPTGSWCTLVLREESQEAISLERELELFQQMHREETAKLLKRTRFVKVLVLFVAMAFAGAVAWLVVTVLRRRQAQMQNQGR